MRTWLLVILWITAIMLAAMCDRAVATWVRESGVEDFLRADSHKWLRESIKLPGEFGFTIAIAIVVAITHPSRWRGGAFLLLATLVSGANGLIKWIVGRMRPGKSDGPFHLNPFPGGITGIFQSKNLCFPSGHAALAFATAAGLAILWPRWRWAFFAGAAVVAAERFLENAHWLSDCVAAAALGVGGVHLIRILLPPHLWPDSPREAATVMIDR